MYFLVQVYLVPGTPFVQDIDMSHDEAGDHIVGARFLLQAWNVRNSTSEAQIVRYFSFSISLSLSYSFSFFVSFSISFSFSFSFSVFVSFPFSFSFSFLT